MPQKTQLFLGLKKYRYVGVIATLGGKTLLQINRKSLEDDSLVISLQSEFFRGTDFMQPVAVITSFELMNFT